MPKLKTHSGAKKRFKKTGNKKKIVVVAGSTRRQHGTFLRPKDMLRQSRGKKVLFKTDGENIMKHYLRNSF